MKMLHVDQWIVYFSSIQRLKMPDLTGKLKIYVIQCIPSWYLPL